MFVLIQCGNFIHAYLILIRLTENVLLLEGFCFCSIGRYDCPILPPTLIKLSTMMGFKDSNLLCFDKLMSFFKVLNSFRKHSNWAYLNILNSACSVSLPVILGTY